MSQAEITNEEGTGNEAGEVVYNDHLEKPEKK